MATAPQRTHLAALQRMLLANEPLIHYRQLRPMQTKGIYEQQAVDLFARGGTVSSDCSETVTWLCRMAGLQDPNGMNYNGLGYTGTLLAHLPHYTDPTDANVGALVVWSDRNHPNGNHVAMVLTPGQDPWLFSHGSEAGPKRVRLSSETAAQERLHPGTTTTFLSVARL